MSKVKQRIRTDILKRRGLRAGKYGKVEPDVTGRRPPPSSNGSGKTLAMRLIEWDMEADIEEVLMAGSLGEVAEMLGIDKSTVSKWRLRLGLR